MRSRILPAVLLVALSWSPQPAAQSPAAESAQGRFSFERPAKAAAPGPRRLPIDEPLLAGGAPFRVVRRGERVLAEDGLADLRLFDADGRAVPGEMDPVAVGRPGHRGVEPGGSRLAVSEKLTFTLAAI